MRLAGRLGEDQRGLRRVGGQERDGGGLARYFLREEFEEVEVAVGESADDQLSAIGFGGFGEQGCGLRGGKFVP